MIASGDVDGREVCLELLRAGAAAVMLARHALGRPWIFDEMLTGAPPPAAAARLAEVRRFVADVEAESGAARRRPSAPVLAALPRSADASRAAVAAATADAARRDMAAVRAAAGAA